MTAVPTYNLDLLPQHKKMLADSAISTEVAEARGYRSVTTQASLKRLGFSVSQLLVPTLLVPVYGVSGSIATYQHRPDTPRIIKGRPLKYETPSGSRMALDVPTGARRWLADPTRPLFITEGVRKGDAAVSAGLCCVALCGVWNWRGTNDLGGKVALADWESVALNERDVYIVFDDDVMTKPSVQAALRRLKEFLGLRGARVRVIYLPSGPGGTKQGLDDFLASGKSVDDLLALASDTLRPTESDSEAEPRYPYRSTPAGLVRIKRVGVGDEAASSEVPLTNFEAQIVSEVIQDDGSGDLRRNFELEASLNDRSARFVVGASRFEAMGWATEHLGASAVVWPGQREHAQAAIRVLSAEIVERRQYMHTGWSELADGWVYLHAGGAIGSNGSIPGIDVRLPTALERYVLPDPPVGEDLVRAIQASLTVLDVAPRCITAPLLASVYRAVLGSTDYGQHLAGPTGAGKSELASLIAQHFGAGLDARHLPGAWSSTENALEMLLFSAKDALVPIDDFAPHGSPVDVQRLHRVADRVIRAQGNNSARLRLNADISMRAARPPRGSLLSTGEVIPNGHSLRARLLVLELEPTSLDWNLLSACQQDARNGLYAMALGGFVRWLTPRFQALTASLPSEIAALRQAASASVVHRRTPEIVANLAFGFRCFISFAVDVGALSVQDAERLWLMIWTALGEAAAAQADHQMAAEPAEHFLELLASAIVSGRAHVTNDHAQAPDRPEAWGWQRREAGAALGIAVEWMPRGRRVGWLTSDGLFLEPIAAYAAAQAMGLAEGVPLAVGSKALAKRLQERGLLVNADRERRRLTTRRTFGKERPNVLHLRPDALTALESTPSTQSTLTRPDGTAPPLGLIGRGSISWVDSARQNGKSTHPDRPRGKNGQEEAARAGAIGSIGTIAQPVADERHGGENAVSHDPSDVEADLLATSGNAALGSSPDERVDGARMPNGDGREHGLI